MDWFWRLLGGSVQSPLGLALRLEILYAVFVLFGLAVPWVLCRLRAGEAPSPRARRLVWAAGLASSVIGVCCLGWAGADMFRKIYSGFDTALPLSTRLLFAIDDGFWMLMLAAVPLMTYLAVRRPAGDRFARAAIVAGQLAAWWILWALFEPLRHISCVAEGTRLDLAEGGTIAIENASRGTTLLDRSGSAVEVEAERSAIVAATVVLNGSIRLSPSHPVLVDGEWVRAGRVRVGDLVRRSAGTEQPVTSVRRVVGPIRVYDLQVSGSHTFIANGVVVHNKMI